MWWGACVAFLGGWDQSGLHNEFQSSQSCIARPCLKPNGRVALKAAFKGQWTVPENPGEETGMEASTIPVVWRLTLG